MLPLFTMQRPFDAHVHLRDDEMLRNVIGHTAERFWGGIVMPNLKPAVRTAHDAISYRGRILAALPLETKFTPFMTCYLTDNTDPDDLELGFREGIWIAAKLYPKGATTNSADGVTSISKLTRVLERMQKIGMPLLIHGEINDPDIDVLYRESAFVGRELSILRHNYPGLRIVLEHATTKDAIEFVDAHSDDGLTAATITAHHLMLVHNDIFTDGLQPDNYCLPIAKFEIHRAALVRAATSRKPWFFLGTDSAPHLPNNKYKACGCAGCFTAPASVELLVETFEKANALNTLEAFAGINGPQFYGLEPSKETVTLVRQEWTVPSLIGGVTPFRAGKVLQWEIVPN